MNPSSDPLQSEVLTAEETAPMLRVSVQTLRRWAQLGRIPCQKIGRRFLFSRTRLLEWIRSGVQGDTASAQARPTAPPEPLGGLSHSNESETSQGALVRAKRGDVVDDTAAKVAEILDRKEV